MSTALGSRPRWRSSSTSLRAREPPVIRHGACGNRQVATLVAARARPPRTTTPSPRNRLLRCRGPRRGAHSAPVTARAETAPVVTLVAAHLRPPPTTTPSPRNRLLRSSRRAGARPPSRRARNRPNRDTRCAARPAHDPSFTSEPAGAFVTAAARANRGPSRRARKPPPVVTLVFHLEVGVLVDHGPERPDSAHHRFRARRPSAPESRSCRASRRTASPAPPTRPPPPARPRRRRGCAAGS